MSAAAEPSGSGKAKGGRPPRATAGHFTVRRVIATGVTPVSRRVLIELIARLAIQRVIQDYEARGEWPPGHVDEGE